MAFRKKAHTILTYKPDILVVPECEHPDKLLFNDGIPKPNDALWFGSNRNKGLGIFSYSNLKFKVLDVHNENLRMIIPIQVTGEGVDFNLFAVWAYNPYDKDGRYIEQVYKAIIYYGALLLDRPTIIIGDFNSNTIWDKKHKLGNHSNVVKLLEEHGLLSLYHLYHKQVQGKEQHPTFYMYRHFHKPYHIDYCFASEQFVSRLRTVEIGDFDFWKTYSDHSPLIVEFNVNG
jgi:exodeoxyribonuclease III